MEEFSSELRKEYRLLSLELTAGYRHVYLHTLMQDYFLFRYGGNTYLCLDLQWGCRPAANHFPRFLRPAVVYLRNVLGYRVLYLKDLLIAPRGGKATTVADSLRAYARPYKDLERLGIARYPTKGVWG